MHLSYGLMAEKMSLSSEGLKYLLLAETEYRSNGVCNRSWNGEIDVSMFGGMLGMCIPPAISL